MKRKATIERCDNPDCDYEEEVTKDEPATGYHLKGYYVFGGGGPVPEFYAHADTCILPAFTAVMAAD